MARISLRAGGLIASDGPGDGQPVHADPGDKNREGDLDALVASCFKSHGLPLWWIGAYVQRVLCAKGQLHICTHMQAGGCF